MPGEQGHRGRSDGAHARSEFAAGLLTLAARHTALHKGAPRGGSHSRDSAPVLPRVTFTYIFRRDDADVALYMRDGDKAVFDALRKRKRAIEAAFGGPLDWFRQDDQVPSYIKRTITLGGYGDRERWSDVQRELVAAMVRLERALRPHLDTLTVRRGTGQPTGAGGMGGRGSVPRGEAPEVAEAREAVAERAGKRLCGQGFRASPEVRRAVERHAMVLARGHYTAEGWDVEDVSASRPYDLHCIRAGEELRVEVKGTTSEGAQVLLTPNDVAHARRYHPHVALFVVARIRVEGAETATPRVSGGEPDVIYPWLIDDDRLTPLGFAYGTRDRGRPDNSP